MACGGAFYMLGEVEFIIAAEHATFFDPHVTYGMTAAFEPIHMVGQHAVPRDHAAVALGSPSACRRSAPTRSAWSPRSCRPRSCTTQRRDLAGVIAASPTLAVQATLQAVWTAADLGRRQALELGYAFVALGTSLDSQAEGQQKFGSKQRVEWRLR